LGIYLSNIREGIDVINAYLDENNQIKHEVEYIFNPENQVLMSGYPIPKKEVEDNFKAMEANWK